MVQGEAGGCAEPIQPGNRSLRFHQSPPRVPFEADFPSGRAGVRIRFLGGKTLIRQNAVGMSLDSGSVKPCNPTISRSVPRQLATALMMATLAVLLGWLPGKAWGSQNPESSNATHENKAPSNSPQQPNPANSQQPIRVHVEVVNVPVSVLDKRDIPVIALTRKDFKIYENGKRQRISYFSNEIVPPLRIGMILDTSNSARFQLKFEKEAASSFVYNMLRGIQSRNRVFLQTFDSTSSLIQGFTDNADVLNQKIQKLKAGGGKAVYDAIYNACEEEMKNAGPREQNRRVLVLISDGDDVQSKHTLEEAISMAHRAETVIYTIGNTPYGFSNPGDKYLKKLAEQTGGAAFFPLRKSPGAGYLTGYLSHGKFDTTDQNKGLGAETGVYTADKMIALADTLDNIRRELANQYLIGYTPTDTQLDGTYRKIRVVVDRKRVIVRNKPGYFATPGE